MAEFIGVEEKAINVGDPLIFENKTDCSYDVSAGIVFHKSGIYKVSIDGNKTTITEQPTYTDAEIQKIQDLEQAQLEKAYQLGYAEGKKDTQPRLNKKRISDLLWNEYRTMSPHLSAEGVVARRYYCKELWKELFGGEEMPVWMTW